MDRLLRDAITLRTVDALRALGSLERVADLAAMHMDAGNAREILACIEQVGQEAREAAERIAGKLRPAGHEVGKCEQTQATKDSRRSQGPSTTTMAAPGRTGQVH